MKMELFIATSIILVLILGLEIRESAKKQMMLDMKDVEINHLQRQLRVRDDIIKTFHTRIER